MKTATVFVPASIGNVGPGFDVLGLAVDGIGDRATVTLREDGRYLVEVTGRDAEHLPTDPAKNTAAIAAHAALLQRGWAGGALVQIEKNLPLSGGLGGSAASSVAGAAAALYALDDRIEIDDVINAALAGEMFVSGRHLDNILPSAVGGFTLSRSVDPLDYIRLHVASPWWVALVTPAVRVSTRQARAILAPLLERQTWIQQMANTASMVHAFAAGDGELLRRSLDDLYAEPARKSLIPHFDDVKKAALDAGSIGCSISGSGPTIFAIATDEESARRCGASMIQAFAEVPSVLHAGPIASEGVRRL